MAESLIQIITPHFVAGLVAREGKVVEAAPIIRYMQGWDGRQVAAYCKKKNWEWRKIHTTIS